VRCRALTGAELSVATYTLGIVITRPSFVAESEVDAASCSTRSASWGSCYTEYCYTLPGGFVQVASCQIVDWSPAEGDDADSSTPSCDSTKWVVLGRIRLVDIPRSAPVLRDGKC
jgi:hypothetical protein